MTLELKLKRAVLNCAVDITLKRIQRSPERCARNLIELGLAAHPKKMGKAEIEAFYGTLLQMCKSGDCQGVREAFFQTFTPDS